MRTRILILLASLAVLIAPVGVVTPTSAAVCANPEYVTSDENGMWFDGKYVVHNNMWNVSDYDVSETLRACSYRNWSVTATATDTGDGAVKTYPNVHQDWHDWNSGREPLLSSFEKIKSRFAATTPRVGIYNAAYDVWLDGVPGDYEVMIWTDNYRQVPGGSRVERGLRFSGHTWSLWASDDNSYLALVPTKRILSGTLNLKRMLMWLVRDGRIRRDATLGQICFGFEIVSTASQPATFTVTDFALMSKQK